MKGLVNDLKVWLLKTQEQVWGKLEATTSTTDYIKHSKLGKYVYFENTSIEGLRPLIVCHIDTINDARGIILDSIVQENETLRLPKNSKASCLGGDDRIGVAIAYKLLLDKAKCDIVFTCDEEIGGKGARAFSESIHCKDNNWCYLLEIDRAGKNHIASYGIDNPLLEDYIGLKVESGSYTDIVDIGEATGIAGYNLACGYYLQHTKNEYVVIQEFLDTYKKTLDILTTVPTTNVFEIEYKYKDTFSSYSYLDTYYKDSYDKYYSYDETVLRCRWCGEVHPKDSMNVELGVCNECLAYDGEYITEYFQELEEYEMEKELCY